MTQTIIERSKWYRGKGGAESRLLREDGTMCCLGFDCIRRGIPEGELFIAPSPKSLLRSVYDPALEGLVKPAPSGLPMSTDVVVEIIGINDMTLISEETREARLKELFEKLDTEIIFV